MWEFKKNLRRVSLALAVAMALNGCASTGSSLLGGESQLDPRLTQGNDAQFFSRSGFEACGAAAVVGVAACMLAGTAEKRATCAIAAGIAACGIAMGTNYYLDQRRAQYKTSNELLGAMTNDVQQDTQKLQQRSATLQDVIGTQQQKLVELNVDIAQGRIDQAAAKKRLAGIDENIAYIKKEQDKIDSKISSYREAAASTSGGKADVARLNAQIETLQGEAAKLRAAMGGLTAQRDSLSWGKPA
ncbi:lipoprotein [Bordetella ansorpii]|uniref:Lipoprotein n=1 Tax=Bordetella ansorpii TaxID=288768 RepID=A0A157PZR5_9BORD|nr:hypothetical protein [Bordetella ansorpii]SAI39073.1 lipoprotein [Bordetella ansorpii]